MKKATLILAGIGLLALLSLAPLAQAQTNRPSGTAVRWGKPFIPYVELGALRGQRLFLGDNATPQTRAAD